MSDSFLFTSFYLFIFIYLFTVSYLLSCTLQVNTVSFYYSVSQKKTSPTLLAVTRESIVGFS